MCTRYILVHMVDFGSRGSGKPAGMDKSGCIHRHTDHSRLLPVAYPGEPVFLAAEQLGELWGVSVVSVYREVHAGALSAIRIGDPDKGRLVIPAQAIEPYVSRASARPARMYHRLAATARFLGVSYGHLHREVQANHFPAVRIRSMWLVPNSAIDAMVHTALERGGVLLARDFAERSGQITDEVPADEDDASPITPITVGGSSQPAVS